MDTNENYASIISSANGSSFKGMSKHDVFFKVHTAFKARLKETEDPLTHPSTKWLYNTCCEIYNEEPPDQDAMLELNNLVSGNY